MMFEVEDHWGVKFKVYGVVRNNDEYGTTDFLIFTGSRFVWVEAEKFVPVDGGADHD